MRCRYLVSPSPWIQLLTAISALADSTGEEEGEGGDGIHEAIDKQGASD